MGTRKVKDAKDLETGELIYLKGHAKATYMSDGRTVEDAINSNVGGGGSNNGNGSIDLSGYATKLDLEGKVDKVDGKQLSTEDFTTALKNKLSGLNNYDDTSINQAIQSLQTQLNTLVSGNASSAVESFNEIIAFLEGIEDSQSLDSIIASIEQQIAGKMNKVTLAAVATSGNYKDLSNKPTIPDAVTESTVSGWGFTKNTGTYSKPSSGIPKSDFASAVQTSLNKADTALQSYTEQYKGTVTGVKVNGSTKSPSSGTVDIGNVVTSIKINGSTKSPSSGVVDLGTVITSHQDISGKQDKLVSGTNIKTINGESILGSGDIVIEGDAKVYTWDWDSESESVTLSQEEYDNIVEANIVIVNLGILSTTVSKTGKEFSEAMGQYALTGQVDFQGSKMFISININLSTKLATLTMEQQDIPTKTSQLENDSNFVSSDGLKTINGVSILGSGNIVIEGGSGGSSSGGQSKEVVVVDNTVDGILELMEPNKLYVFANEVYHIDIWEFITTNNAYDEYTLHFKMANPTSGGWMPYFSVPECSWSGSDGSVTLLKDSLYELSVVKTTINGTDYFKAIISIFN